jgi:general stress protein 26
MRDTDALTSGPAVPDPASGRLPDQHESRSLDDLVRPGDVAFVTTVDRRGAMSSRPLTVAEVHGGVLMFLVDAGAPWFGELDPEAVHAAPDVHVTIANGRNDWIAMRGRPAVSAHATTIERLWSPAASAYFDDRHDPGIRALQVSVIDGDYWSAPGGGALGRLASVVGAALGRDGHAPGNTHGDVRRD